MGVRSARAAGEDRGALPVLRVAGDAAPRRGEVPPARRITGVAGGAGGANRHREQQHRRAGAPCPASQEPPRRGAAAEHQSLYWRCRKSSWQLLQALSTSLIAALVFASLPLFAAATNLFVSANIVSCAALNFAGSL